MLYTYLDRFVSPATATFHASDEAVLTGILGSSGTLLGPFVTVAIILTMRNWLSGRLHWCMALMGIVFIATVAVGPYGQLGLVRDLRARGLARARGGGPAAEVAGAVEAGSVAARPSRERMRVGASAAEPQRRALPRAAPSR